MARHDLSPEGRLRCAASGSANLTRWRNGEQQPSDIENEIEAIRPLLEARATLKAEPARTLLILSATAQTTKLLLIQRHLLRQSRLSAKVQPAGDDLAPLSSNLLRTLKALGIVDAPEDEAEKPVDSPSAWLARQACAGSES
jgi:hypothetical protein